MSTAEETNVIARITGCLHEAFNEGSRALVVVRCDDAHVADTARETLFRASAPFAWKSLPLAELSPPDFTTFLRFRGKAQGPVLIAYGLPTTRQRGILPEFLRKLESGVDAYREKSTLCVLLVTIAEMREITREAPTFWAARSMLIAWPKTSDAGRFTPVRIGGGLAGQAFGGVAGTAAGGIAAQGRGGVAGTGPGGVEIRDTGHMAMEPGIGPWAGAPLDEDGSVPDYVLDSAAPAGRRWGGGLADGVPGIGEAIDEARRLLDGQQVDWARQELSKVMRQCREHGLQQAEAECFVLLGKAGELRIDFSVAFDWYRLAQDTYERTADHAGYSDCCGFIAYLHYMLGDIDASESSVGFGLARDKAQGDRLRMAAAHRRSGVIAEVRQDLDEASIQYRMAGKLEDEISDTKSHSRTLNHLARIARVQKDYTTAEGYLTESLELKASFDDQPGLAAGYHEMGNLLLNQKRYEEAVDAYEEAVLIEVSLGDVPGIAVTQAQLGLCYRQLLEFTASYESLLIAQALMLKLKSPNIVAVEAIIGDVHSMLASTEVPLADAAAQEFLAIVFPTQE